MKTQSRPLMFQKKSQACPDLPDYKSACRGLNVMQVNVIVTFHQYDGSALKNKCGCPFCMFIIKR